MLDLVLAIPHHVLIFALFGILCIELVSLKPGLSSAAVKRLAIIDLHYGMIAGLIILVGFARAMMAAKGWEYYSHNIYFWAKISTFLLIGVISIKPTVALIKWRRKNADPQPAQLMALRPYLWAELALFPLLLVFAAAMARGYGQVN